jgi:hypothetical protein
MAITSNLVRAGKPTLLLKMDGMPNSFYSFNHTANGDMIASELIARLNMTRKRTKECATL